MDSKSVYDIWCQQVTDPELSLELSHMTSDEICESFSENLKFGTAGARAVIGAGSSRFNILTVAHIAYSFSKYLVKNFVSPSVVVSYDTRKYSKRFAKITSQVLSSCGVKVYFFDSPQPIGLLSFTIRDLKCSGGVMITASHNPPEYNGFKVYNSLGAQPIDTSEISENLSKTDIFDIKYDNFDYYLKRNLISILSNEFKDRYIGDLRNKIDFKRINNIDIVYSPLNGCACDLFCSLFSNHSNLHVVPEQKDPDESFSSCRKPDPQSLDSFKLSIDLAKKNRSDVIILNDPDGDRLGIALRHNDEYRILSGIEIGALLLDYMAQRKENSNMIAIKSVVTGGLAKSICDFYGIHLYEVLPGFKYISDLMDKLESENKLDSFIMGFEESNGFLLNSSIRDKDGISSSMFFCEMVSFYKSQNRNCVDVLEDLYKKFGYHTQENISIKENDLSMIPDKIERIKKYFMSNKDGVVSITDYNISEKVNIKDGTVDKINLPPSNMLSISFESGKIIFIRASGTEPIVKIYRIC